MTPLSLVRRELAITGQVQGVGFRPFVYRLAQTSRVSGFVANEPQGVRVEVQGPRSAVAEFLRSLRRDRPAMADVTRVGLRRIPPREGEEGFAIAPSAARPAESPAAAGEMDDARVAVDTVVCPDCLRELLDPADRRFGYPFINCSHCGPRYSIIRHVPYDRPNTTMAGFAMCPECHREYTDPADRRYHAQPIACPACGPKLWLADPHGVPIVCDDPIAQAARLLRRGKIIALKGLGGFQLAVRADREAAVRRLRERKHRQGKPFALMVADLAAAERLVKLTPEARALLASPGGPIVLLDRLGGDLIAPSVAPQMSTLGVMLPTTPLHHLLMRRGLPPLVMTSGNLSDEPLIKDNDEAVALLGRVADGLLLHDRPIERQVDDSVFMLDAAGSPVPIRRARGFAPAPLPVPYPPGPRVLALGAEVNSVFCLYGGGRALLSEHIGDLKDGRAYRHFLHAITHLEELYGFQPDLLAADMHPGYLATQYAVRRSRGRTFGKDGRPVVFVQHHHAHIASVLAEHGRSEPVIGIAADGTGYGPDGAVWGCELLRADLGGYERLGHLKYFTLPGGDLASTETIRPAISLLTESLGEAGSDPQVARLLPASPQRFAAVLDVLRSGLNCPPCSSLGRLLDGVAALCGLSAVNAYEGHAPMALEAVARGDVGEGYSFELLGARKFEIDYRPMIREMVADLARGTEVALVAGKVHATVADFLAAAARRAREVTGLSTVALSGGCFANRVITARLVRSLQGDGFTVLQNRKVPCNDGGIALGQAVVACHVQRASRMPPRTGHVGGQA